MNHRISVFAGAWALASSLSTAQAADVVVRPASGSSFVVKDASGTSDRLRVQESGAVSLPSTVTAPVQTQVLCMGALGDLGPCANGMLGSSYSAGAGLNLAGTTFSVAPTYRLPQSCTANQVAQWNGTTWSCGSAGASYTAGTGLALSGASFSVASTYQLPQSCSANQIPQWSGVAWSCGTLSGVTMPAGTTNQTLRYDASNALVANNLLQAFADGGLVAGGTAGTGSIPTAGVGTRLMWYPAKGAFRAGTVSATQWDDSFVGARSVAVGEDTKAYGTYAVAMGFGTTAGGTGSVAMGYSNTASGDFSTATGDGVVASGNGSMAMGSGTKATGIGSTAMGQSTTASDIGSTAMGQNTMASNVGSTAMGTNLTAAVGPSATAMGHHAVATGDASTAMGTETTASGQSSVAMGLSSIASGSNSLAIGDNATASGATSVAMGTHASTNGHIGSFIFSSGGCCVGGPLKNTADSQFMALAWGGFRLYTTSDLSMGVYMDGGSSGWNNISDRNVKTAVQSVDAREVLKKVAALPMNTWQYKTQEAKYRHMGPMAQDFYAAFHLGTSDKSINTVDADGVALAAIQGLNALLTEKDAKIAALETELATQKQEMAAQKIRLAELSSMAADLAEVKAQLAALRRSAPSAMTTVASVQP